MKKIILLLFLVTCVSYSQVSKEDFESTLSELRITANDIETATLYNVYPLGSGTGSTLIFNKSGGKMIILKDTGLILNIEPDHLQDNQITFIPYTSIEYFALNNVYMEIVLKRTTPY